MDAKRIRSCKVKTDGPRGNLCDLRLRYRLVAKNFAKIFRFPVTSNL
jgi:hypothetical protein